MNNIISTILSFIMAFSGFISGLINPVEYTPVDGRDYPTSSINTVPDTSKHISVSIVDEGQNIYAPAPDAGYGYRYGPTILTNADGSIDCFFAAPGAHGEWDWITYIHSPDGGKNWTKEKKVFSSTGHSMDYYSVCDPGVVKMGDYYYLGYTSTIYSGGVCNNTFVARSKTPDGPYEKWNGTSWGGNPEPIVYYDGDWGSWGSGEPSFIVMGDELYIYYSWKAKDINGNIINQTRVSVADATDENWPATMQYKGVAIDYCGDSTCDSADVKYIEEYGKFIAVSTSTRMSENSYISFYESNDGFNFHKVNDLKTNVAYYCHNSGISSRPNGHISTADKHYVGYAYGPGWAYWGTRMQEIDISLKNEIDLSDINNENWKLDVEPDMRGLFPNDIGITTESRYYQTKVSDGSFKVKAYIVDRNFDFEEIRFPKYSDYDDSIIKVVGNKVIPLKEGHTSVTVRYKDFESYFEVYVRGEDEDLTTDNLYIKDIVQIQKVIDIHHPEYEAKQFRVMAVYNDNSYFEIYGEKDGVQYTDYDTSLINITADGCITAVGSQKGETPVTVTIGDESFTTIVKVH